MKTLKGRLEILDNKPFILLLRQLEEGDYNGIEVEVTEMADEWFVEWFKDRPFERECLISFTLSVLKNGDPDGILTHLSPESYSRNIIFKFKPSDFGF